MGSYNDRLNLFKMIYGKNVLCTDGLFHIIDDNHKEIYINRNTGEIDKRGKYKTIAVFDNVILANVIGDRKIRCVVLNKKNLECLYKTTEEIVYVDKNVMFDRSGVVLSHTGKTLIETDKIKDITSINDKYYVIQVDKMYSDKLIEYVKPVDKVVDLTCNGRYTLQTKDGNTNIIELTNMVGGKYSYDLTKQEYFDEFTLKNNGGIQLWNLN